VKSILTASWRACEIRRNQKVLHPFHNSPFQKLTQGPQGEDPLLRVAAEIDRNEQNGKRRLTSDDEHWVSKMSMSGYSDRKIAFEVRSPVPVIAFKSHDCGSPGDDSSE
jgi:hypothetical protein